MASRIVWVDEVAEKMNVSTQKAYALIRDWNRILEACGCQTVKGGVDRTFFLYKLHGDKAEDCQRIDVITSYTNSDGKRLPGTEQTVTVLYNKKVIEEAEVEELIRRQLYEYDNRLIVTTPEAADAFCNGKKPRTGGMR